VAEYTHYLSFSIDKFNSGSSIFYHGNIFLEANAKLFRWYSTQDVPVYTTLDILSSDEAYLGCGEHSILLASERF
jgi:hypothetical protein